MSSQSRIETRSMRKRKEQEQNKEKEVRDVDLEKKSIKSKSQWSSVKSSNSSILLAKKKAKLEAARKIADLEIKKKQLEIEIEKTLIEKELEVELAELSLHDDHSSVSTEKSKKKVQKWLEQQDKTIESQIHDSKNKCISKQNENCENVLSDIQLLAQEISNLRRPSENKELPPFFGNISEWLSFKAAYEETKKNLSDSDNIARLRRCLRGNAREAVASLLHTHVSPNEIIDALELRFGRSELILQEQINILKELPKLNDSTDQLCKFACKIRNCVAAIKTLNKPEHLYNIELLQALKLKMPQLKHNWLLYASEHEEDDDPEIVKLSNFLHREAMAASKFWILEQGRPSHSQKFATSKSYYTEEYPEINNCNEYKPENCLSSFNEQNENLKMTCPFCRSKEHRTVYECNKFKEISVDERWKWAQNNNYCFKCLRSRHRRENCRSKPCGLNGCRMSHNRLLHANAAKATLATSTLTEPFSNENNTDESKATMDGIATCTNCVTKNQVLLKIIPVNIRGPLYSKDTFALLDEGSTLTLLKENVAKEIGMRGTTEPFTLAGVNATTQEQHSMKGDLEIVGPSKEIIHLEGIRTVKNLPLTTQTVSDLACYEHLCDLPIKDVCYDHATPELLIGQDNWHALIAKETRCGKKNEPVATLTSLGWVIHGFRNSYTKVVNFVGSIKSNIDEDTHKMVEEYFKIDSLVTSTKKRLSSEDARAMEILEQTARRVDERKKMGSWFIMAS